MLVLPMLNEAWISIKSNKLRSMLTILGIVIGVMAVVLMVAVGQTVRNEINKQMESFGGNKLIVLPGASKRGGLHTSGNRPTLTYQDAKAIKNVKNVKYVAPIVVVSATLNYNGNNWKTSIYGITEDYFPLDNIELEEGTFFTDYEVENATNVIIIGQTVRDSLFANGENVLGEVIRVRNIPFTVIGVTKKRGSSAGGADGDDVILTPLFAAKRKLTSSRFPNSVAIIMLIGEDDKTLPFVQARVENLLRERHSISEGKEDEFNILNLKEIADKVNTIGVILSVLLASIASVSLFVGSIGIMNMMLVSVTERTREIGIRKAIGAEETDILMQFLFESILISLVGSFIGMIVGVVISQIGGHFIGKAVPVSPLTIIVSIIIAFVVGIASGIVPAKKATELNPIDALRYQ